MVPREDDWHLLPINQNNQEVSPSAQQALETRENRRARTRSPHLLKRIRAPFFRCPTETAISVTFRSEMALDCIRKAAYERHRSRRGNWQAAFPAHRTMIYYPIQTLVGVGIHDIMIVTGGRYSAIKFALLCAPTEASSRSRT